MASDKTEKATPKRQEEARKKGQIAKSQDLNGAVIMLVGLMVLGATGASMAERMGSAMRTTLQGLSNPEQVTNGKLGDLLMGAGTTILLALAPVVGACAAAAIFIGVLQVGIKPKTQALKPDFKHLSPVAGAKRIFGPNALFETGKNLVKVGAVGAIVMMSLLPQVKSMAALVGMSPQQLGGAIKDGVRGLALRACMVYLLIGIIDYAYQKWRNAKGMRMDKQEVKEEGKGQALPAEVRGAMRRRQMQSARARMMAAVPEADVIITNPTHYAVALRYDGSSMAPEVVAKGKDLIAFKIRELAKDAGVPIVPDPPLARSLHASVEIGQQIPEELFEAVAQVLAYVYRVSRRARPRAATASSLREHRA
jgi:flagellar biosynthetic protein FlhB